MAKPQLRLPFFSAAMDNKRMLLFASSMILLTARSSPLSCVAGSHLPSKLSSLFP